MFSKLSTNLLKLSNKNKKIWIILIYRIPQSPSRASAESPSYSKTELIREDNYRREISAAKKRLAKADELIRKLESNTIDPPGRTKNKRKCLMDDSDLRKLKCEIRNLRETTRKVEEKLQVNNKQLIIKRLKYCCE